MAPAALVVDDERALRRVVRGILEDAGWRVTEAFDGEDALDVHRPGAFDVVILDLRMPRRDGLETLLALREAEPDLGVVFVSGDAPVRALDAVVRAGRTVFLAKPFGRAELLTAVASVAPSHAVERAMR